MNDIWRTTGGNAIVVTDVGQHQMWEAQYYKHDQPRTLITSGGLGTMGFALPAAIGAKMARRDAEVWVVAGDGGFQMTQCELATLQQEQLDVKIAVINNGYLGMVRQWQEFFHDKRYAATPMLSPDFVKLAQAYDIEAYRVSSRPDVVPTVEKARAAKGRRARRVPGAEGGRRLPDGAGGQRPQRHDPPARRGRRGGAVVKHTLVAKVMDQPGVLNRVASLFRRRAFNIDSLTVGHTETAEMSRMTIVVDTARVPAHIVAANLRKLIPVAEVVDVTHMPTVDRDLALIRVCVRAGGARRAREPRRDLPRPYRGRRHGVGDRRGDRATSRRSTASWSCCGPGGSRRWCGPARWPWSAAASGNRSPRFTCRARGARGHSLRRGRDRTWHACTTTTTPTFPS